MRKTILLVSIALIWLSAPGNAFGTLLGCLEDGEGPKQRMQIVVPQNQLKAFRPELQKYAARKKLKFSELAIPHDADWGRFAGRNALLLMKRQEIRHGSIIFQILTTPSGDTFDVELYTCDWDADWRPFWRDFLSFADTHHYRQIAN